MILTGQQTTLLQRYDHVQKPGFAADRAIAVVRFDDLGRFDLKPDRLAMTATLVFHCGLLGA
jgi:hypothetical protein